MKTFFDSGGRTGFPIDVKHDFLTAGRDDGSGTTTFKGKYISIDGAGALDSARTDYTAI